MGEEHQGGRFEPGEERNQRAAVGVREGCYLRCGGVCEQGERTAVSEVQGWRVFKGDPEDGIGGYKEECIFTFLTCPPHCSRLMRRGRERARI